MRDYVPLPENPQVGTSIRIDRVIDKRIFEPSSQIPSMPSLMNKKDYSNDDIKSRAIGRKRGGFGNDNGDIVLPENEPVGKLVRDIMTRAFRDAGFPVLESGDPGAATAVPIYIEINEFWGWSTPHFGWTAIEFKSDIEITGNIPGFINGKSIKGYSRVTTTAPGTGVWIEGLNRLIEDTIKSPEKTPTGERGRDITDKIINIIMYLKYYSDFH